MSVAGELRILEEQYAAFSQAMLAASPQESVAACAAGWWHDAVGNIHLVLRDWRLAQDDDYVRRASAGAQVTPSFLAPTVKRCRRSREALILAHTHPFSRVPSFSGIDDGGEDVLVPKVRERAPDAPHGGLVIGTVSGSARAWPPDANVPMSLRLRRLGHVPDGGATDLEHARQDLAFGPGTTAALGTKTVAVIGTGGLGWQIAHALAAHGVGTLIVIDHDVVEAHNRPRLPGSRPDHVGIRKVKAFAETVAASWPDVMVKPVPARFADRSARALAATADVIVIATDTLASRLDADRFARRVCVPLVDAGINLQVADGRIARVGGRVNVSWPLGPCEVCMGVLTPDAVAAEVDPLGYRGQGRADEASVLGFNTVVAGLAVNEVIALLLPVRAEARASRYLVYDGLRGIVREVGVPAAGSCRTCGDLTGAVFGTLP